MRYTVLVKPNAKETRIRLIDQHTLEVAIHAPARDGEANQALIAELAGYFDIAKTSIRIIRGHTARRKLVEVDN